MVSFHFSTFLSDIALTIQCVIWYSWKKSYVSQTVCLTFSKSEQGCFMTQCLPGWLSFGAQWGLRLWFSCLHGHGGITKNSGESSCDRLQESILYNLKLDSFLGYRRCTYVICDVTYVLGESIFLQLLAGTWFVSCHSSICHSSAPSLFQKKKLSQ